MAVPSWEQFMVPLLRVMLDGQIYKRRDLYPVVASAVGLSDEDCSELLASGHLKYRNRIGWATSYLTRVGALDRPMRGQYSITDAGRKLLVQHPDRITEADLRLLAAEGDEWWIPKGGVKRPAVTAPADPLPTSELDPIEQIEQGISRIHADVASDLLSRLHGQDPAFFEQAVLDLLMAMGYGGAEGKATRTQLTADGGIDGIVDQDALGLSRIYVQAKRYALDNAVGRPDVQGFVGALHGNQASQGVFITSGRFSSGARQYVESVPTRVVLIDGQRLASLMIRFGVGVQTKRTVTIVEVDEDFFE